VRELENRLGMTSEDVAFETEACLGSSAISKKGSDWKCGPIHPAFLKKN
jgi:hypothetical protein